MAERTGLPQVDQLIDRFLERDLTEIERADADQFSDDDRDVYQPLAWMRDGKRAWGWCHVLAGQFARFLEHEGVTAWSSEDEFGSEGLTYTALGYTDAPGVKGQGWIKFHCVTLVEEAGERFMVDWTASQYGYAEFPMVQRYDPAAQTWQREFVVRPDISDVRSAPARKKTTQPELDPVVEPMF